MRENIKEAEEELKRADHLVYVTLKYTRTADVIKNVISRLINAYDLLILEALEHAKKKRKIKEIPTNPVAKCEALVKVIKNKEVLYYLKLYNLLKKIYKAEFLRKGEYRKNVALVALMPGKKFEVNMEKLREFFEITKDFLFFIHDWVLGGKLRKQDD
ncbi:hypothetical protein CL621_03485 [archaeon]|nr:hypothetical protein [archaeon]|tara:strand:- start:4776 stop:5249 length:474 start_codon:yes stop_codon:yes gene_type:complete